MRKLAVASVLLLLPGCYESSEYEKLFIHLLFNSDLITETEAGVFVFEHKTNSKNVYTPPASEIDQWWEETQTCINLRTEEPPFVFIIDVIDGSPKLTGKTVFTGSFAYIQIASRNSNVKRTWKHEFIHFILDENNFYLDGDPNHGVSLYWDICQFL